MRKILLDFGVINSQEQIHDYLALELDFPEHYGRNLDALYDCLTDICEDTCLGIFIKEKGSDLDRYLRMVNKVLKDAEEENTHLCVIFNELEENYEDNERLSL